MPTRNITIEETISCSPEVLWKVLTTSDLIARWLMPNDFAPTVGRPFTFQTKPMGNWDGVVHCVVTEVVPNERLVYSWKGGADGNDKYGAPLDTVATWTLAPVEGGTRLSFIHSGFKKPENDFAFNAMAPGWMRIAMSINKIAREIAG